MSLLEGYVDVFMQPNTSFGEEYLREKIVKKSVLTGSTDLLTHQAGRPVTPDLYQGAVTAVLKGHKRRLTLISPFGGLHTADHRSADAAGGAAAGALQQEFRLRRVRHHKFVVAVVSAAAFVAVCFRSRGRILKVIAAVGGAPALCALCRRTDDHSPLLYYCTYSVPFQMIYRYFITIGNFFKAIF